MTKIKIPGLVCPSSEELKQLLTQSGGQFAKGNYGGNFSGDDAMSIGDYLDTGGKLYRAPFSAIAQDGMKIGELQDGTTNVILVGELLGFDATDDGRGAWGHVMGPVVNANSSTFCAPSGGNCTYSGPTTLVYTPNTTREVDRPAHCTGGNFCADATDSSAGIGIRSRHIGGAHILLGDGSSRFVSENVDARTWRNLFSSRGQEVLGEF